MTDRPSVSVIVPVRNRRALLRRLLDALAVQTYTDFEVIVVDDGSFDATLDEAARERNPSLTIRCIPNEGAGASAGRNSGAAAARAEILAFTDSDCVPSTGWLAAGVAAIDDGADLVNGVTRPRRPVGLLERTVQSGEEGLYPTCNVFYRRAAFEKTGGFDPDAWRRLGFGAGSRSRGPGVGDDTLLAWAVRRDGPAVFEPAAVVEHEVSPTELLDALRRTTWLRAFPSLVREVPELRGMPLLRQHVFLGDRTRAPIYILAAAIAGRRRRVATMAVLAWLALQAPAVARAPGPLRRRVAALPSRFVLDAVAAGALVFGSVRARTLVL
jgi:GT2 family glycosyltransferase